MTLADRLAAIEARCAKATKGPWSRSDGWAPDDRAIVDTENIYGQPPVGVVAHVVRASQDGKYTASKEANADFIAHARTDVPFLLAALRRAVDTVKHISVTSSRYRSHKMGCPAVCTCDAVEDDKIVKNEINRVVMRLEADLARLLGEGERG